MSLFFIDEDLPRSTADIVSDYGHEPMDIRDTELRGAKDHAIARYLREEELSFLTGDSDFGDIRNYPPHEYAGIVVISVPGNTTAPTIRNLVKKFFEQNELVRDLPGKLVIVGPGSIRVRE